MCTIKKSLLMLSSPKSYPQSDHKSLMDGTFFQDETHRATFAFILLFDFNHRWESFPSFFVRHESGDLSTADVSCKENFHGKNFLSFCSEKLENISAIRDSNYRSAAQRKQLRSMTINVDHGYTDRRHKVKKSKNTNVNRFSRAYPADNGSDWL